MDGENSRKFPMYGNPKWGNTRNLQTLIDLERANSMGLGNTCKKLLETIGDS